MTILDSWALTCTFKGTWYSKFEYLLLFTSFWNFRYPESINIHALTHSANKTPVFCWSAAGERKCCCCLMACGSHSTTHSYSFLSFACFQSRTSLSRTKKLPVFITSVYKRVWYKLLSSFKTLCFFFLILALHLFGFLWEVLVNSPSSCFHGWIWACGLTTLWMTSVPLRVRV